MIVAILQQAKTELPSSQITGDGNVEGSGSKQILLRERRGSDMMSNPDTAKIGRKHILFFCPDLCLVTILVMRFISFE